MTTIHSVAVIGSGYMGGGIAQSLALNGFTVRIADLNAETAQRDLDRLFRETEQLETDGLFAESAADTVRRNLSAASSLEEAVEGVDFVEEAVSEVVDVKHAVLRAVSAAAPSPTIIGSNTSTIPVHVLAEAVSEPERFLTVHWSNPAPFIPGVELIVGERTDPGVLEPVKDMLHRAGRIGAVVADTPGFVLNRLQYVLLKEAMSIVEEGIATSADVDTIVRTTFGFRLPFFGPFEIADMAGLDVYANGFSILEQGLGERFSTPALLRDAVADGHHGTKNGQGLRGSYTPEQVQAMVHRRSVAYARMSQLLHELDGQPVSAPDDAGI